MSDSAPGYAINTKDDERSQPYTQIRKPLRRIVIEPVVLLYFLSLACSLPLQSQYLYHRLGNTTKQQPATCDVNKSTESYKRSQMIEEEASLWSTYIDLAKGLPAIFTVLFWGSYSDNRGRKIPLIIGAFGVATNMTVFLVVELLQLHLGFLLIGYVVEGLSGGFGGVLGICFAYLSDQCDGRERSIRISITEGIGALGLGGTSVLVGYLLQQYGFFLPILLSASFASILIAYVIFLVPETVVVIRKKPLLTIHTYSSAIRLYFRENPNIITLRLMILIFVFITPTMFGGGQARTLYQMAPPLCWDSVKIGYYLPVSISVWVVGGFLGFFIGFRVLGLKDIHLIAIGTLSGALSQTWTAFAHTDWMMFTAPVIGTMMVLIIPLLRAAMSKLVEPEHIGALFASIAVVETGCNLAGSAGFSALYSATVGWYPGFLFLVEATFNLGGLVLACALILYSRRTYKRMNSDRSMQAPDADIPSSPTPSDLDQTTVDS